MSPLWSLDTPHLTLNTSAYPIPEADCLMLPWSLN